MKRREFIGLVGGATVAWPLSVHGQQPVKVHRVAYVVSTSPLSELVGVNPSHPHARAFLQAMRDLGYAEGRNLVLERRSAEGQFGRLPEIIQELVSINVDVILSPTNVVTQAAKKITQTVPIVMVAVSLPVERGFVQSLAKPGNNITGVALEVGLEIVGKKLQLMKELLPKMERLALLHASDADDLYMQYAERTSRELGFKLLFVEDAPKDYSGAFARIMQERPDALFVAASPNNYANRGQILKFAEESRLPAMYFTREFAALGGLISHGTNLPDLYVRAAEYVDKILKGAKPADLAVQLPTKFDLVINLKTAKALELTVPVLVLGQANEVIEHAQLKCGIG